MNDEPTKASWLEIVLLLAMTVLMVALMLTMPPEQYSHEPAEPERFSGEISGF